MGGARVHCARRGRWSLVMVVPTVQESSKKRRRFSEVMMWSGMEVPRKLMKVGLELWIRDRGRDRRALDRMIPFGLEVESPKEVCLAFKSPRRTALGMRET